MNDNDNQSAFRHDPATDGRIMNGALLVLLIILYIAGLYAMIPAGILTLYYGFTILKKRFDRSKQTGNKHHGD